MIKANINKKILAKCGIGIFLILTVLGLGNPVTVMGTYGINRTINFQGKLVDSNGVNVPNSTPVTVTFSIYETNSSCPGGGTAVWFENQTFTPVDGIFQVALGSQTAFGTSIDFSQDTLYLGIKISTETDEMCSGSSRIKLASVPQAFNAEKFAGLTADNSQTDYFTITGGQGTPATLKVDGNITVGPIISPTSAGGLTVQSNGANGLTLASDNVGSGTAGNVVLDVGTSSVGNGSILIGTAARTQTVTIGNSTGGTITVGAASGSDLVLADADWGVTGTGVGTFTSGTVLGSMTFTTNNITDSGALTIKSAAGANALTLDSGSTGTINLGTGTSGKTINIGTDNTNQDTINIGSALDDVAITGDQWSITNAGVLTVQTCIGCGSNPQTIRRLGVNYTNATTTFTTITDGDDDDDQDLTFQMGTSQTWVFEAVIYVSSPTLADHKLQVTAPANANCKLGFENSEDTVTIGNIACGASTGQLNSPAAAYDVIKVTGTIVTDANNSGRVSVQYGQFAASGTSTIQTGSYIIAEQVGGGSGGQTITLTGDVTGSGSGLITTTIEADKVVSGMILDGTIAGGDLATDIDVSTTGNLTTIGTGAVTSAGAFVGPTTTNTINNLIVDAATQTMSANSILDSGALTVSSAANSLLTLQSANNGVGATGGVMIASGNAGAGTAGDISLDVGTSTSGNGSILIGTAARNQTITVGNTTGGTITVGAASGSDLVLADADWGVTGTGVGTFTSGTVLGSLTFTTSNIVDSGALTIKSGSGANALTLDSGTTGTINLGTGSDGKTINIGTDNTNKDTINIGSALDDVAITGDQWSVTNAGVLTVQSCVGCGISSLTPWTSDIDADNFSLLDVGSNITSRGAIAIGSANNGAGTAGDISVDVGTSTSGNGSILIGTAARNQTVTIGNTTGGTITIGGASGSDLVLQDANWGITGAGAGTLYSLTATTGNVAITSGALTLSGTTRIDNSGVGTLVSGTTIGSLTLTTNNIEDVGSLTIKTAAGANALTLDSGTVGDVNIGTGVNAKAINIGTGAVANTITIGSSSATGLSLTDNNWSIDTSGAAILTSVTTGGDTINDFSGNGLEVSGNALAVDTTVGGDGLSSTTSSGSGLETLASGVTLLQGCADGQVLKWNETSDVWECGTDLATTQHRLGANFSRTNTVFTTITDGDDDDDQDLTFQAGLSETWIFEAVAYVNSPAAADMKFRVNAPAGATCKIGFENSEDTVTVGNIACGATSGILNSDGAANVVRISGTIVTGAGASGRVSVQFGQQTASGTSTIYAGSSIVAYKVSGADLAEVYYSRSGWLEPGTVVAVDPALSAGVKKTEAAYDQSIIGVVSESPGLLIGDAGGQEWGTPVKIALSGRIPVKVTTENGEIKAGDNLTSSSMPGVAMKATKAGPIVGMAMTDYSGEGVGTVTMFAKGGGQFSGSNLSALFSDPAEANPSQAVLARVLEDKAGLESKTTGLSLIVTDRVVAGLEVITPTLTAEQVIASRISARPGEKLVLGTDGGEAVVIDASGSAKFSGGIIADWIKANRIEGVEVLAAKYSGLESQVASLSGLIINSPTPMMLPSPTMTPVPSLDMTILEEMILKKGLTVSGPSVFSGDALFEKLTTFNQPPLFGKDTAGEAIIKAGSDRVEIVFDKEYPEPPVVSVNISLNSLPKADGTDDEEGNKELEKQILTGNYSYIISRKTGKGFSILLNKNANTDVVFSWTAWGVKDRKTFTSILPVVTPVPTVVPAISPILISVPGEGASVSSSLQNDEESSYSAAINP